MPNWCANDLTISGKTYDIHNMLFLFDKDKEGNAIFSFEKIYPTPDELLNKDDPPFTKADTIAKQYKSNSPLTDINGVSLLGKDCVLSEEVKEFLDDSRHIDWVNSYVLLKEEDDEDEIMSFAKDFVKMVNNLEVYGFTDWYGWRVANWGTKWNIAPDDVSMSIVEYKGNRNKKKVLATFDTAWAPPLGVLHKLSERFPELEIKIAFFEGGCCFKGTAKFKGGEMISSTESSYRGTRGG
jgi:hypothetical protein